MTSQTPYTLTPKTLRGFDASVYLYSLPRDVTVRLTDGTILRGDVDAFVEGMEAEVDVAGRRVRRAQIDVVYPNVRR